MSAYPQHVAGLAIVALQEAMPLQSRVSPFGEFFAMAARGTLMGNRGGRLHDPRKKLGTRRWASEQWICCKLDFDNRRRKVWGDSYTELFFLDEVTAFAAGHRPCFECRRKDALHFALLFPGAGPQSVHAALDLRLRGDERQRGKRASASEMDDVLHAQRLAGKAKRTHRRDIDRLPDGAMVVIRNDAFAVRGQRLLRWTPSGYSDSKLRPRNRDVDVLTPPAILVVLSRGYKVMWHKSAGK